MTESIFMWGQKENRDMHVREVQSFRTNQYRKVASFIYEPGCKKGRKERKRAVQLTGIVNENVAPFSSLGTSAHISPPCASTMFFDMKSPNPIPLSDFDANFLNNLGIISGSIPFPVSSTRINNTLFFSPFSFFLKFCILFSSDTETVTVSPSLENLMAFPTRLVIT